MSKTRFICNLLDALLTNYKIIFGFAVQFNVSGKRSLKLPRFHLTYIAFFLTGADPAQPENDDDFENSSSMIEARYKLVFLMFLLSELLTLSQKLENQGQ